RARSTHVPHVLSCAPPLPPAEASSAPATSANRRKGLEERMMRGTVNSDGDPDGGRDWESITPPPPRQTGANPNRSTSSAPSASRIRPSPRKPSTPSSRREAALSGD